MIYQMEKECFQNLRTQEQSAAQEYDSMKDPQNLTLEKTLAQKARERHQENKKRKEEDANKDSTTKSFLYPYLEKLGLLNKKELTVQEAQKVKTEVMNKLKERLLSRAEIIQQRLE